MKLIINSVGSVFHYSRYMDILTHSLHPDLTLLESDSVYYSTLISEESWYVKIS